MTARYKARAERRRLKRRQKMVEAALALLNETTLRSLDMVAAAEGANVSKSTLYKHFGSRQAFIDEIIKTQISPRLAQFEDAIGSASSIDKAVYLTLQALLESLLSLVSTCGHECLMENSIDDYLQETIGLLTTKLSNLDLADPHRLSAMTCTWAYGMAVALNHCAHEAPFRVDRQACEVTSLLLAGYSRLTRKPGLNESTKNCN